MVVQQSKGQGVLRHLSVLTPRLVSGGLLLGAAVVCVCTASVVEANSAVSSPQNPDPGIDASEAPSPLWLIVMPAIPLAGGGLIYAKRRVFKSATQDPDNQN